MTILSIVFELLLIVGGIIAMSALIVAQKPEAAKYLERLMPYQALIGTLLLIIGVVFLLVIGPIDAFRAIKADALPGVANLGGVIIAVILGFVFALPTIVGLAPNAQQRAQELAAKVLPFQLLLGLLAVGCGVLGLLYQFGILKYTKAIGL